MQEGGTALNLTAIFQQKGTLDYQIVRFAAVR